MCVVASIGRATGPAQEVLGEFAREAESQRRQSQLNSGSWTETHMKLKRGVARWLSVERSY